MGFVLLKEGKIALFKTKIINQKKTVTSSQKIDKMKSKQSRHLSFLHTMVTDAQDPLNIKGHLSAKLLFIEGEDPQQTAH